jgi:hypothetical protein
VSSDRSTQAGTNPQNRVRTHFQPPSKRELTDLDREHWLQNSLLHCLIHSRNRSAATLCVSVCSNGRPLRL